MPRLLSPDKERMTETCLGLCSQIEFDVELATDLRVDDKGCRSTFLGFLCNERLLQWLFNGLTISMGSQALGKFLKDLFNVDLPFREQECPKGCTCYPIKGSLEKQEIVLNNVFAPFDEVIRGLEATDLKGLNRQFINIMKSFRNYCSIQVIFNFTMKVEAMVGTCFDHSKLKDRDLEQFWQEARGQTREENVKALEEEIKNNPPQLPATPSAAEQQSVGARNRLPILAGGLLLLAAATILIRVNGNNDATAALPPTATQPAIAQPPTSVPTANPTPTSLPALQLAQTALEARDYEQALQQFSLHIAENPDDADAFYQRSQAYYGLYEELRDANQLAEAKSNLLNAMQGYYDATSLPDHEVYDILYERGLIFFHMAQISDQLGDVDDAINAYGLFLQLILNFRSEYPDEVSIAEERMNFLEVYLPSDSPSESGESAPGPSLSASYAHTNPGVSSEIYLDISGAPNAEVHAILSGPGLVTAPEMTSATGASGSLRLTWTINKLGSYLVRVTIDGQNFERSLKVVSP